MFEIYRTSFRFFSANFPALLLFAGMLEGLLWAVQPKSEVAITLVPLIILAYSFHRHFLFGEGLTLVKPAPRDGAPPFKWGWFLLASLGLIAAPLAVTIAVVLQLISAGLSKEAITGTMLLFMMPSYLIALSLFGTALPALVARDPAYRLKAGMRSFYPAMGRLILGPGMAGLVFFALGLGFNVLQPKLGIPTGSLGELAIFIFFRMLGFLVTILAVAVLCQMYKRVMQRVAPS
ncbi:MAG: hypothetical protein LCH69_19480 [Proteobacteria bacterium]|nr:hypothetical protein [Pseudomonadota bacterium]